MASVTILYIYRTVLCGRYEGELRSFELSQQSEKELLVDALRAEIVERMRVLTDEHTAAKGLHARLRNCIYERFGKYCTFGFASSVAGVQGYTKYYEYNR